MKVQRLMALGTLLMISLTFASCGNVQTKTASGEDFFKNFNQYEADATVFLLKDSQPNELAMKQKAQMDGTYEMEYLSPGHLKGSKITYDGEKVVEYFPGSQQLIEEKPGTAEVEILLTSFTKRFLQEENVKRQETALNGEKMITYEMPISGQYKYLSKEKLWLSKKSMTPVQLEIYDRDGNVTIQVRYENFKYNS